MSKEIAREVARDRIAQLGQRDAAREIYRATHTGKRARRFILPSQKASK